MSLIFAILFFLTSFTQDCEYNIYPNPCRDYFYIESDCEIPQIIEIYTFDGRLAQKEEIGEGQKLVQIDVSSLNQGTYIIILKDK